MNGGKSHTTKSLLSGWLLTKVIALFLVANVVITFLTLDMNEKAAVSFLIRSTARLSFVLFMTAFAASSLHFYFKNTLTQWLLINRRYIGVSFAISHYLHLGALLLMTFHISFNVFENRGLFTTVGGGIGYVFITLMALTSFDRTRNLFGAKNWKRLHTIGGYYLWIIFAKSYLGDMSSSINTILAIIAVSILLLRISVLLRAKKR